jgi:hypothetical protein
MSEYSEHSEKTSYRSWRGKRLDAVGWAIFFIWIGTVFLVKSIPNGVGALGVGVIVLVGTLVRVLVGISVSLFWVIIGLVFLLAGVGGLLKVDLPLLPIALIVCGILMLIHQRSHRRGGRF